MINGTRIPPCVENDFMSREGAVDACAQKGPYHTKLKREMSLGRSALMPENEKGPWTYLFGSPIFYTKQGINNNLCAIGNFIETHLQAVVVIFIDDLHQPMVWLC